MKEERGARVPGWSLVVFCLLTAVLSAIPTLVLETQANETSILHNFVVSVA